MKKKIKVEVMLVMMIMMIFTTILNAMKLSTYNHE